jgi:hypothetical protein
LGSGPCPSVTGSTEEKLPIVEAIAGQSIMSSDPARILLLSPGRFTCQSPKGDVEGKIQRGLMFMRQALWVAGIGGKIIPPLAAVFA